jgi:hypothetical protein
VDFNIVFPHNHSTHLVRTRSPKVKTSNGNRVYPFCSYCFLDYLPSDFCSRCSRSLLPAGRGLGNGSEFDCPGRPLYFQPFIELLPDLHPHYRRTTIYARSNKRCVSIEPEAFVVLSTPWSLSLRLIMCGRLLGPQPYLYFTSIDTCLLSTK